MKNVYVTKPPARTALLLFACLALAAGCSARRKAGAVPIAADIRLSIGAASAVRQERGAVIRCNAELCNWSETNLVVKSQFNSAFDGLSVVVRAPDGKALGKTSFLHHQSPGWTEPRPFPVPVGVTTNTLVFVPDALPPDIAEIIIQVVGDLPGSGYNQELRSNCLTVQVARAQQ